MSLEAMAVAGVVLAVVLAIVGLLAAFSTDNPGWLVAFVAGVILLFGSVAVGSTASDKNHCLKTIPQISGKETKWLSGECFVKANDGKFVPQEWIEEGYND